MHRGPTLNNILPKLADVKYLTLTDASSGYHILNFNEQSSYLTIISCPFGRYKYKPLPFGVAQVGYMLQKMIDELFNRMPNVFGIADDIQIEGFGELGRDHNNWTKC